MAFFEKLRRKINDAGLHNMSLSSDWTFCEYYDPDEPLLLAPKPTARRGLLGRGKPRNP